MSLPTPEKIMIEVLLEYDWIERYDERLFVRNKAYEEIFSWLENLKLWPKSQIILFGESKSGKTHLVSIWAKKKRAQIIGDNIEDSHISGPFVVDGSLDEGQAKFLFSIASEKSPAIWVLDKPINEIFKTEDMRTRMSTLICLKIPPLDENLFEAILLKRCGDYGLLIGNEVIEYLIKRAPLTYSALDEISRALHEICLIEKRPLTIDVAAMAINHKLEEQT